jgi:uncharacterized protein YjbK
LASDGDREEHGDRGEEREFKLGIPDAAAASALIERAGGRADPPVVQENHFFDSSAGGLRARRIGLRIRREDGRHILTLKGPSEPGADARLSVRAELECALDEPRARAVLDGALPVTALLDELAPAAARLGREGLLAATREAAREAPLRPIGSFRNQRTVVHTRLDLDGRPLDVLLEFDRTEFAPDHVRFEVELEVDRDADEAAVGRALETLFDAAGVSPTPTRSKLAVFQDWLDRRSGA